jgi:small conductance mechanosensitive channel
MDMQQLAQTAFTVGTDLVLKIAGAIVLWVAGRWLIQFIARLARTALTRQSIDATVARYLETAISVVLTIALGISILGFFGVQTTTFAALLAAGGVAIGVAWGGLLANFAAGVFLVVLRPFKVGDDVTVAGITGKVETIGLFGTVVNTPDQVRTIVGNNKIFSDTIYNFSANPYRRVDLLASINSTVDHNKAIRLLRQKLQQIPNVLTTPAPEVDLLQLSPTGPVLCVRPYCRQQHYGQVYFDTNRMIREAFGEAGFPAPVQELLLQTVPASVLGRGVTGSLEAGAGSA